MKQEENKETVKKERISLGSILSRLPVAIIALALCATLILWDAGLFELPFLTRKERREPVTTEEPQWETSGDTSETLTQEIVVTDWAAYARATMDSLTSYSFLEDPQGAFTTTDYMKGSTSLVKTRLPYGKYTYSMGYLISPDGVIYRAKDLAPIPGSEDYTLTAFRDSAGSPVFCHKEAGTYHTLDETFTFISSTFDPTWQGRVSSIPMPHSYGAGQEELTLTWSDGLFGYTGSYLDGRRRRTFTVENQYPTAFSYSEGFAVMADAEGKVTVRSERGEPVLTHLSLVLPDLEGFEALGFHYFDQGLLRVLIATYGEDGTIVETQEKVIDAAGNSFVFPAGYTPVSYYNGIFVVTDGNSFGYYSAKGAWITSPIYSEAQPFFEGLAVVKNKDGKYGMIDLTGKEILPCTFDAITPISEGACLVSDGEIGSYLLTKVTGDYMPEKEGEEKPPETTYYTKITITRGPQNTFDDDEESEILELPPVLTTTTRQLLPEFWE